VAAGRLRPHAVRLELEPGGAIHSNLSGAACTDDWLWVAGDEACGVERLQRLDSSGDGILRFGAATTFPLSRLLDLPGGADEEADLEGMAVAGDCLWVVGSHGLKRRNVKPKRSHAENARRLAETTLDGNRRLLARLPIERDPIAGPRLVRDTADGRMAVRLEGDACDNALTRLLAHDPHFRPFMGLPGKDNGFDIEGLAVDGERLLLGLRGPVLRGWSAVLEIAVQVRGGHLELAPLDGRGTRLRKHFLDLGGLGVRDLHFDGDDLWVLAGPTMALDGAIRLFRWSGGRSQIAQNDEPARFETGLTSVIELPHGHGTDRAEAICRLPDAAAGGRAQWLVLYDAPGAARCKGEATVFGDLLVV